MKQPRQHRCSGYVLLEVVMAIGLLAIVFTGTYSGMHCLENMQRRTAQRQTALDILDNTLERLAAEPVRTPQRCAAILRDEFSRAAAPATVGMSVECRHVDGGIVLAVIGSGRREVATVTVGRTAKE